MKDSKDEEGFKKELHDQKIKKEEKIMKT